MIYADPLFLKDSELPQAQWKIDRSLSENGNLAVRLSGDWNMKDGLPLVPEAIQQIESIGKVRTLSFVCQHLGQWDSGLLNFLIKLEEALHQRHIEMDRSGLPEGVDRLLKLASAVPERKGARRESDQTPFLVQVGNNTIELVQGIKDMVRFLGESVLTFFQLLRGRAKFRRSDFFLILQECGAYALPIVSLISVLIGLILAYVGALQLQQFGAQIYVANLVGLGMAREMGAMMAGIIMAGRTGAAFAAQLGTMTVNEEIDALSTLGISPMEFLVLPRMLAMMLMMPLLCLYADLVGILGGAMVGIGVLDLSFTQYVVQTKGAITLTDFGVGLSKSVMFGVIVALSGCLRGMQCGRSSSAVGLAATSAVVTAIVLIIVTDSLFTIMFNILGI